MTGKILFEAGKAVDFLNFLRMKAGKLLIADDNKSVLNALHILLSETFEQVVTLENPELLLSKLQEINFDVVVLDMNFRSSLNTGNEGMFWLRKIKKEYPDTEVVILTAYGDVNLAVNALKEGATDFILKPWENDKLVATLKAALRQGSSNRQIRELKEKESILKQVIARPGRIIHGGSPAIIHVMELAGRVAVTDANVLITGENGTGKELVAREIQRLSGRKDELFVTVDLVSLSESLFESELFGHKKGAFTDAIEDRTGKFVLAHKGTLFLDEIGNLPLHLQSKLLTVLQNRVVIPVGTNREIPIDIRLIAATNKKLEEMVSEGLFRQDLLYRINTIQIHLPPLRERKEDIEALSLHFLNHYCRKYDKTILPPGKEVIELLREYNWPGNIRELQHAIERAVILCRTKSLSAGDFQFQRNVQVVSQPKRLEDMERQMIREALKNFPGSMNSAARELGITRQTLYNKIKKYGI